MAETLLGAAGLVLAATVLALLRILSRRNGLEQMLAVQLMGTWGAALLLLVAFAQRDFAVLDVALVLVLLAAFSSTGFVLGFDAPARERDGRDPAASPSSSAPPGIAAGPARPPGPRP